jgi:hypothetical protein
MSAKFATYTEASLDAFKFNPKSQELLDRKKEIFSSIANHHGNKPKNILFYGFSPLMLICDTTSITVTDITTEIKKVLDETGIKYEYIKEDGLSQHRKGFDWVVATDEYFTFAETEQEQINKIKILADLAKSVIVTTLRDYKNQDFRDREFSQPLAVRKGNDSKIFLEFHDYDYNDKNSWETAVYELLADQTSMKGQFSRRSMFFKQMAKFSMDAGAKIFYVHKNLMYKSLIKKNYEHVISISF